MSDEKFKQIAPKVVLAQTGNKNACRELYSLYYKKIFLICSSMTNDRETANRLTAEIFIKMFEAVDKLEDHMAFEEWFYALAVNLCRKDMTEPENGAIIGDNIPEIAKKAGEAAASRDKFTFEHGIIKILEDMIAHLPAEARVIFFYSYFADIDSDRIAVLENCEQSEIDTQIKAVGMILDKQAEKIKEYGIDVSMFIRDMRNSLIYISSKMFVPDSVHNTVSEFLGTDVNPFAEPKKEKAEKADNKDEIKPEEKGVKKNLFSKNDLILFAVVFAVSLIVFSAIKLRGKIPQADNSTKATANQTAAAPVWNGAAASSFASGQGTKESPFIIENAGQLAYLANLLKDGNTMYASSYYRLAGDINLNNTDNFSDWSKNSPSNKWMPVGDEKTPFSGVFDGADHTIGGMYISGEYEYAGLFGAIKNGTVENLSVCDSFVENSKYAGGIAGNLTSDSSGSTKIAYCGFSGIVKSENNASGGITGSIQSDADSNTAVENCCVSGSVYSLNGVSGGIFGSASLSGVIKITDIFNTARVESIKQSAGGIAGSITATEGNALIGNCYNSGKITSGAHPSCGIAGSLEAVNGRINTANCYMLDSSASTDVNKGNGGAKLVTDGIKKLSDEQMRREESYSGFNFSDIWQISGSTPYPTLRGVEYKTAAIPEESST